MYSKNNYDRPKAEREYFDRPMEFQKESYTFTPSHKRPIDFLWDTRSKAQNIRTLTTGHSPARSEMGRSKTSTFKPNRTFTSSFYDNSATL